MNPDLEARVKALEDWRRQREIQQIVFPLDAVSVNILKNYVMVLEKGLTYQGGVSGNTFTVYLGRQGSREFQVAGNTYYTYTVNPTTNVFTTQFAFEDGQAIVVVQVDGSTLPAPLVAGVDYYVVNSGNDGTFQLSATPGGAAIDITTAGSGEQYFTFF